MGSSNVKLSQIKCCNQYLSQNDFFGMFFSSEFSVNKNQIKDIPKRFLGFLATKLGTSDLPWEIPNKSKISMRMYISSH